MGWVLMSERDVRRIEVLTEVFSGRRTVASAAVVLAITVRQVNRLLIRLRENGGGGLIHKGRGQSSNHRLSPGIRAYALELVRTKYADFGPTLATEVLLAKHDIQVGRETLRTWMVEDGLWLSRKQRRSFHQPRLRRESYGELVQIDGSDHRWFEQRTRTFRAHETPSKIALSLPTLKLRAISKPVFADLLTSCFFIEALYKRWGQTCYLHSATCQFEVRFHEVIAFTTSAVLGPRSVSYTTSF
jgi:hypothetical protein